FRTEKLSLVTPMVLRNSGRVGNCRFSRSPLIRKSQGALLRLVDSKKSIIFATDNYILIV
ncbi:hypothetical protein, partial [Bacteroides sp.]|uniref:hypothetical protein n=1 Tax=Bacteroides sp. TaxID=29523 RepID=UPI002605172E